MCIRDSATPAPATPAPPGATPAPATPAPGTPAPPVVTPSATTQAAVNQVTNNPVIPPVAPPATIGTATGDPHFRIIFDGTDICYDIAGHDGTVFNLLHEPSTGLTINGQIVDTVSKSHRSHRLAKIGVISPNGGMVAFNATAIETHARNVTNKIKMIHR